MPTRRRRRNRPSNSSIRAQAAGRREPTPIGVRLAHACRAAAIPSPDTHVGHLTRMPRSICGPRIESLGNDSHTEDRIAVGVHALVGFRRARSRPPMSATEAVPSRGRRHEFPRSARSSAGGTAGIRRPRTETGQPLRSRPLYPPRGTVYRSLPDGYRPYYRGGSRYYFNAHLVCAARTRIHS